MARLNALLVGGTAIVCAFRGARRACVRCSLWPKVSVAVLRPSDSGPWSTSSLRHRQMSGRAVRNWRSGTGSCPRRTTAAKVATAEPFDAAERFRPGRSSRRTGW